MNEKVYLEADEEITSVIDKIKNINTNNVFIVVPRGATLIQSIVNLKLLKRQGDALKKKIIIITGDEKGRNLAKKAGIKTKSKLLQDVKDKRFEREKEEYIDTEYSPKSDLLRKKAESKREIAGDQTRGGGEAKNIERIRKGPEHKEKIESRELTKSSLGAIINRIKKQNIFKKDNIDRQNIKKYENIPISNKDSKYFKAKSKKKIFILPSVNLRTFLIFFGVSLVITGIVFFIVLPKAIISVVPKAEPFSTNFEMIISNNVNGVDIENVIIPGESVDYETKSDKRKFEATGEKEVGEKARGEIIVYNGYSSESQTLVSSTKFYTNGMTFYSLHDVVVPGATIEAGETIPGRVKVRVEAEAAGEKYNIGPSSFSIPNLSSNKQSDIYGKSIANFDGGFSKKAKVVSNEDLENAKNVLLEETYNKIIEKLEEKIGASKMLAYGALKKEIIEIDSSVDADNESDDFEISLKVKVAGFAFNKNDLEAVLINKFSELVPSEKYILNNDPADGITFESVDSGMNEEGAILVKAKINKQVAWKLDEQKIKKDIKGKDKQNTENYLLENPNIYQVEVSFWPFWVKKVPWTEKKIQIVLDTSKINDKL